MSMHQLPARNMLIGVSSFAALSAIAGGLGVIFIKGLLPLELLQTTPFTSFIVPGIILTMVVGGSALMATHLDS